MSIPIYRRQDRQDNKTYICNGNGKTYICNGNAEGRADSPLPSASLHCRYRHWSHHCPLHLCIAKDIGLAIGNAQMQRAMARPMSVTAMQRGRGQWRDGKTLCIAVIDIGFVVMSALPSVKQTCVQQKKIHFSHLYKNFTFHIYKCEVSHF